MTATYLHKTLSVNTPSADQKQLTVGPAATAWWVVSAVKITVDFSGKQNPLSRTPGVLQTGGHVVTSVFVGAPNALDIQSRFDITALLNDTTALLSSVVVYPGQYITALFQNSSNLSGCICTIDVYGIEYDTPPPIGALPSTAGAGFRGSLITGAALAPTEVSFLGALNPGVGNNFVIRQGMHSPVTLYNMTWTWAGQSVSSFATQLGNFSLYDSVTHNRIKVLMTDPGDISGTVGLAMPQTVDFGGITINEFAYDTTGGGSGLMDLVFEQVSSTPSAGTTLLTGMITYSQGLNIPLF